MRGKHKARNCQGVKGVGLERFPKAAPETRDKALYGNYTEGIKLLSTADKLDHCSHMNTSDLITVFQNERQVLLRSSYEGKAVCSHANKSGCNFPKSYLVIYSRRALQSQGVSLLPELFFRCCLSSP